MGDEKCDYYQLWHTGIEEPINDFPRLAGALPFVLAHEEMGVAQTFLTHAAGGKRND